MWFRKPDRPEKPDPIIEMHRRERESAERLISKLFPPINPSDAFDHDGDDEWPMSRRTSPPFPPSTPHFST